MEAILIILCMWAVFATVVAAVFFINAFGDIRALKRAQQQTMKRNKQTCRQEAQIKGLQKAVEKLAGRIEELKKAQEAQDEQQTQALEKLRNETQRKRERDKRGRYKKRQ